ncbi:MAG TPA: hypothetical protein VK463_17060 [Desulfomonilaceae bacterium]|nr:hypothetical protein [Desulfomonilaceae bacterium]
MIPLPGFPSTTRVLRIIIITAVVAALSGPVHTFALWMPWAKEEDKVKKAVEDVWNAFAWNDKRTLKQTVAGPAAQVFVDQQLAAVRQHNVKTYRLRFKSIKVDRVHRKIAFAEYYKIATLANGRTVTESLVSVVEKIDGQWKLMPSHKKKAPENKIDGSPPDDTEAEVSQRPTPGQDSEPVQAR